MKLTKHKLRDPSVIWTPTTVGGIYNYEAADVVKREFDQGSFIAGGFARRILTHLNPDDGFVSADIERQVRDMNGYLVNGSDVDVFVTQPHHVVVGDEDWFKMQMTTGAVYTKRLGSMTLQVIDVPRTQEETFDNFDIFNACVAFDAEHIYLPDGLLDFEDAGQLHVHNWKRPYFTVGRITKWMYRQGLSALSPETAGQFGTQALIAIGQYQRYREMDKGRGALQALPDANTIVTLSDDFGEKASFNENSLKEQVRKHLPLLTNDQLLLLLIAFPAHEKFMKPFSYDGDVEEPAPLTPFELLQQRAAKHASGQ